jgi:hypothetical protein
MQSETYTLAWCCSAVLLLLTCQSAAQDANDKVLIWVSYETVPTFSWIPDSAIGLLIVKERGEHLWDTEAKGGNNYQSPIRYGVHPSGSAYEKPATPLVVGRTYTVLIYRWVNVQRQEFQLIGMKEFSPTFESRKEKEAPVADATQKEETRTPQLPPIVRVPPEKEAVIPHKEKETPAIAEQHEEEEEEPEVGPRRALRVGALTSDFKFDGIVNGPVWWAASDSIHDLITIEPEEGGVPAGRTHVKVVADKNEIVVGARCYDDEPEGIVSFSKARDSELEAEDHLLLVLDTFLDGRSGYVFGVNPSGARFDGLIEKQGDDVNSDWDAIWEAKTSQDDSGWSAEVRIPIKSLGFKKALTTWGFNVQRRVQRLQETSRWSGAKIDYEIFQTSRAGHLTNLPEFDFGAGLSVRPSIVGRASTASRETKTEFDGDFSLDITQKLGSNLLAAFTVNTDFAETEVDVRQINVTRFPLFFPEKRTFFLEGADIFEFGVGLDEEKLVPFFSRRIGLLGLRGEDQSEIPITVGGKVNGRVGNTNIGALVVNTRKLDSLVVGDSQLHVPQATMGAVRIKQNILDESSVGMLATFGDQQSRSDSWSAGLDFTFRTSSFLEDKNFVVGIWGMLNDRDDLEGDKSAFGFKVDYPNDLFAINVSSTRLGDGFDPSLGFTPRNNLHIWEFSGEYKPRPGWEFLRQMFFDLTATLYNTRNNSGWESYVVMLKPFDWLFESGDRIEATVERQGDRPPEAFEIATDVDIPSGSYEWTRFSLGARTAEKRIISAEVKWASGDYYNGDLNTIEARLTLKPSSFLALEFTAERNTGTVMALQDEVEELAAMSFTEELYGFRAQLNFSPDLQFSSLTQYDVQSREIGSNNKLRWTFDPLGDIFIVYNHNLVRNENNRWVFVSNQLPIKIQYALRF